MSKMRIVVTNVTRKPWIAVVTFIVTTSLVIIAKDRLTSHKVSDNFSRDLSLNLGGGKCMWKPPTYEVPDDLEFTKTLIAGFPSGDKRMTYVQMEALTGLSARDEWDFEHIVSATITRSVSIIHSLIVLIDFVKAIHLLHDFSTVYG